MSGYIWPLMVLYGAGCFCPVLKGRGRFWPDLWIFFASASMSRMLLDGLASSRWFWSAQEKYGGFWMCMASFIFFLMVMYGVGWFCIVSDGSCRFWPDLLNLFTSSGLI